MHLAEALFMCNTESAPVVEPQLLMDGESGVADATGRHTISPIGSATSDTTIKRCGTSSLYFVSGGASINRNGTDLELGTNDFTIDLWIYTHSFKNNTVLFVNYSSQGYMITATPGLSADQDGGPSPAILHFRVYQSSSLQYEANLDLSFFMYNMWNHVAFIRSGTSMYGAVNGQVGTLAPIGTLNIPASNSNATIGNLAIIRYDNLRITNGLARWTSNFSLTDSDLGYTSGTLV